VTTAARKTVLVVDDDRDVRATFTDALESEGYCVVTAADGLEALEWLTRAQATGASLPDVILLDLQMPKMGGAELRARIGAEPAFDAIPVVALSGEMAPPTASTPAVRPPGDPAYAGTLHKPIALDALLAVVCAHCRA
jgi:CheY-like chemotaxis protein